MSGRRRPNLFVIGAQKSGTTSLHTYLNRHPDVFMSDPKEPGYFTPEQTYYPRDLDWYLSLFDGAGESRYVGESSTHYTKKPDLEGVPERIAAFSPKPRLLYVMRDPVRRAISHYWHKRRRREEHRSIVDAIQSRSAYRHYGDYELQLRPYFDTFGADRIYTLTFENLFANPRAEMDAVLSWLGLAPLPAQVDFHPENSRPQKMVGVRGRGRLFAVSASPAWSFFSPLVPGVLKDLGRKLALERVEFTREHDDEVTRMLAPWALDAIDRVEALLGKTFPEWRATVEGYRTGAGPSDGPRTGGIRGPSGSQ